MEAEEIKNKAIEALRACYDPEVPVNIYDLGLIYGVEVEGDTVSIRMTLTSPACPVAGTLPGEVQHRVAEIPEVSEAHVDLVWDPPWNQGMMSEEAKLQLGLQ